MGIDNNRTSSSGPSHTQGQHLHWHRAVTLPPIDARVIRENIGPWLRLQSVCVPQGHDGEGSYRSRGGTW